MNKYFYLYTALPLDGVPLPKHVKLIHGSILCVQKDKDLKKVSLVSDGNKYNVAVLSKSPISSEAIKTYIATRLKFPKAIVLFQPTKLLTKDDLHQIVRIGYDGIAWKGTIKRLVSIVSDFPKSEVNSTKEINQIQSLRQRIDIIDEKLLNDLSKRNELVRKLGAIKNEKGIAIVQPQRWNELLNEMIHLSAKKKLPESFIYDFMELIHLEAIKQQLNQK